MISITASGSFDGLEAYLMRVQKLDYHSILAKGGQKGVSALSKATPTRTGLAAGSWIYKVSSGGGSHSVSWHNTNTETGFPVAIMLEYGYGNRNGGYVQGRDYINPAIQPVFDEILSDIVKAVSRA